MFHSLVPSLRGAGKPGRVSGDLTVHLNEEQINRDTFRQLFSFCSWLWEILWYVTDLFTVLYLLLKLSSDPLLSLLFLFFPQLFLLKLCLHLVKILQTCRDKPCMLQSTVTAPFTYWHYSFYKLVESHIPITHYIHITKPLLVVCFLFRTLSLKCLMACVASFLLSSISLCSSSLFLLPSSSSCSLLSRSCSSTVSFTSSWRRRSSWWTETILIGKM